ncbi:MAG: bifunctional heptose 7-phosphate kinase/heptose 1-phosphate adenyltransferase [Planctomycetes bacterium]|nr:bifunctional heptose 7-phosphate kinase/heptose 1-phosphate adenyltransferase [Planctomycetota bacterium]
MHTELIEIVKRFGDRRILLVGDFMLDRYEIGDAERISPEAPVAVLRIIEREHHAGGAGSVATIIAALEAHVDCLGLVGSDPEGQQLCKLLSAVGTSVDALIEVDDRPTILKTRMIGLAEHRHRQQMIRADYEVVKPPLPGDAERLLAAARAKLADADLVCLEDYAKGLLTTEICQALIADAKAAGKRVIVDPARTSDYAKYRGASILTPNQAELEMAAGRSLADDEIATAAAALVDQLELEAMIVTLGRRGALLVESGGRTQLFATQPRAVYDNTGAGDAVLAMTAVSLAAGATLDQAVRLANIAGGIEVSKFGCVPISRDEVLAELDGRAAAESRKIRQIADLKAELTGRRARGETIVFTNGCFDILHPGHVRLLDGAKTEGSLLVVGVNSDASVRGLGKGGDRPVRSQSDRMFMLAALESVDYVVLFDEPDPGSLIEQIAPDVLVKGGDWAEDEVIGAEYVKSRGGRVVLFDLVQGYGTTDELERIRSGASP